MSELNVNLTNTLVLTNEGGQPIILNNIKVTFKWRNVFLEGDIAFSTFENIVDDELLGFDIDFVKPMTDGNMMLVGKTVRLKAALLPAETVGIFDLDMINQAKFERQIIAAINNSESELFQEYNWLAMELYQIQGVKHVGHETIWNVVNYQHPDLFEEWDMIVDEAAKQFMVHDEKIEDLFNSIQSGDVSKDELTEMMKKAKDQMMGEDNPMGGMLSKMFGDGEDFEKTLSESMDMMMSMFGGEEDKEADDDDDDDEEETDNFEMIGDIISEHLEMLELDYEFDEVEMVFSVKYESMTTKKVYDTVIACGDDHIHVLTMSDNVITEDKAARLYRLLNGMNAYIKLGKIILNEHSQQLIFRTELSTPILEVFDEPIIDIIDENWVQSEDAFTLINQFLEGKLSFDEAMEEAVEVFV
jgi:hypothetical protein